MKLLVTLWRELIGLFVEDESYAVAIVVWGIAAAFLLPHLPNLWRGPLLALGLLAILLENVLRSARR